MAEQSDPPAPTISKRSVSYALRGLGVASTFVGVTLFRMVFLPGRVSPDTMAPFRPDHPAFVTSVVCVLIGLLLFVPGVWLARAARREASESSPPS